MKKNVPKSAVSRRISRRGGFVVATVFLFSLLLSFAVVAFVAMSGISSKRHEAEKLSLNLANEIGRVCARTFQLNEIISEIVLADEKRDGGNFERVAKRLLKDYPAADCVQLAPNGVVLQCVPLEGNEAVIGHNLFSDGERSAEVVLARTSGKLSIGGPYPLRQGGEGFIGRLPIYNDVWKTDFWGFVNVVVRVKKILEIVDFSQIKERDFKFSVFKVEKNGKKMLIAGDDFSKLEEPVISKIAMPNADWQIAVSPNFSWLNVRLLILISAFSVLIVILSTLLSLFLLKVKAKTKAANLSGIDPLTGLYLKENALNSLKKELAYATRNGSQVALCKIDVQDLKSESATVAVADKILSAVRSEDIIARGENGDFLVILRGKYTGTNYKTAVSRIKKSIHTVKGIGDISIGLAVFPDDGDTIERLLQSAENKKKDSKCENSMN